MSQKSVVVNVSRRGGIRSVAMASAMGITGCSADASPTTDGGTETLTVGGSSTVYPITSQAVAIRNSSPPAADEEYWGPSQHGISTDEVVVSNARSPLRFERKKGTETSLSDGCLA